MKTGKQLSADGLFRLVHQRFGKIKDHRPMNVDIPLDDALMSGFAMFSLKDPSLLVFDRRRAKPENLRQVYGMQNIPSDTQMRTILDNVEPDSIQPPVQRRVAAVATRQSAGEHDLHGKILPGLNRWNSLFHIEKDTLPSVSTTEEQAHR